MMELENTLLRQCAWCKRINLDNKWVGEEYPNYEFILSSYGNNITHAMCEDDAEKMKREYKEMTGKDL